jgi:hypothetical protein
VHRSHRLGENWHYIQAPVDVDVWHTSDSYKSLMRTSTLLSIGFKKLLQQSSILAVTIEDFLFNLNLYSLNMAALDDPVLPLLEPEIEGRSPLVYNL